MTFGEFQSNAYGVESILNTTALQPALSTGQGSFHEFCPSYSVWGNRLPNLLDIFPLNQPIWQRIFRKRTNEFRTIGCFVCKLSERGEGGSPGKGQGGGGEKKRKSPAGDFLLYDRRIYLSESRKTPKKMCPNKTLLTRNSKTEIAAQY
ncbi:hypothetical protein CEXT_728661 [Caerostris extrusa]|uniref:Uncharacterized protein n=1 Tax=Caerostris extrusa TaxID=172846 RepID=A0AAV4Y557_CAEEX|nr:hypothetical protein CEXT_728661 [Caerostris extrusa]